MNILFFGTADISKVFLENILSKHSILAVITMCDKPANRGGKMKCPSVKTYAIENNIPYIQVDKFSDEIIEQIKQYNSDVGVVVSFGKIIPEKVFTLPKYGCFNIHFSLLPQYRGASPVQQSLIDGQKKTGVSSFYIEKGLDSGSIILQDIVDIADNDTSAILFDKLNISGIDVMNKTLDLLEQGKCQAKIQEGMPTFCSIIKKEDGRIDWNKSAKDINNLFRGLFLWPGIFCSINDGKLSGKILKIIDCQAVDDESNLPSGTIVAVKKGLGFVVKCGEGCLLIIKVQPESKSQMSAYDFLNGSGLSVGNVLK
ncbi:MAG: methionyl-tRNA formyltransferase [Endomicrobiaceae bacterium]|nr:methionyl-tRNA formyltransferase [Endomicrobiaceae bacterium]